LPKAAAIVGAVAHREYRNRPLSDYLAKLQAHGVVADVKSQFVAADFESNGISVWRL
jgi:UDP-N-acetyl-D-galactosamine dehydrogenase